MGKKIVIAAIVMIGMFLLVVTNVSALTLRLEPSSLVLNGEPDTEICTKLTIEYSVPNGLVEGRDLWAEEGEIKKDLSLHTLDASELNLEVSYLEKVNILGSKDVDICVTAEDKGLYHGALLYRTMQGGGVGIELNVWVIVDTKTPYFFKDKPKEISAFSTVLEITTNEDVAGDVIISEYGDGLEGLDGKDLLGDSIEINAPEVEDKLESVIIKKYYTIEQLNENNLGEDSLKLYYYNDGNWEELNSGINKNAKFVYATVDHFSIFGIFGNILTAPSKPVVVDDGDSITSTTSLHAQWSSISVGSDISEYMYAIGTSPETTNIVDWTSTTTQTSVTKSGLSLTVGKTYYFSVKARNDKGWSEVGVSDGIEIIKSGSKKSSGGGGGGGSGGSFSSDDFINLKNTGAQMTGGIINMNSTTEGDENNKGGNLLTVMPIILLTSLFILITLIGILFVKKSKKKSLSK